MTIQLLAPLVEKEKIDKSKFSTLPADLQLIAKNYSVIHKVTITPQKVTLTPQKPASTTLVCKTGILNPESWGTPGLVLINRGRVGPTPAANEDDLRPGLYYALSTGTQKFRTNLRNNTNHYTEVVVKFE